MNKKIVLSVLTGGLVFGGLLFFAGYKFAQSKFSVGNRNFGEQMAGGNFRTGMGARGTMGQRGGAVMAGLITGEILSKDAGSLTLKTREGGSKVILMSSSTKVMKSVDGTTEDLLAGKTVMVQGENNTDGSVSAQSLQLRDAPVSASGTVR